MRIRQLATIMPLALGLALSACNRIESGIESDTEIDTESAAPTAAEGFPEALQAPKDVALAQEAQAIKAREKDPAKREAAMRALTAKYGYPVRPPEISAPVLGADAVSGALGKVAGTNTRWMARAVNVIYHFAHSVKVTVPVNTVLEVAALQVDGASDPMVLGFYKSASSANASAYWVNFVGYNDDQAWGDRNATFMWKNTTSASKTVQIVSWSYPGTSGITKLAYQLKKDGVRVSHWTNKMWVSGNMQFKATETDEWFIGCTGPNASEITLELYRTPTRSPSNYGHSLVAFNANSMRGAFIRDTDYTLRLLEPMPADDPSFLLGYFEGDGYQPDPMDGSRAAYLALDAHYHYPFYFARQTDTYSCP